jgi:hypothetical protein
MANSIAVSRAQLIYAVCLPLAILMGYLLADPQDLNSLVIIGLVLGALCIPAFMRWYHPWLFASINAATAIMLLPGNPPLWMLLAVAGSVVAVLNRFTNPEARFVVVPSLVKPLLFLLAVVIVTGECRGGFGMRILGSSQFGGRYYFFLVGAVMAYFALTSKRIPIERAHFLVGLFFLTGLSGLIPVLAPLLNMDFLLQVFPSTVGSDVDFTPSVIDNSVHRPYGLIFVFPALFCGMLAQYGLRGIFDFSKPWRLLGFIGVVVLGSFSGFRSSLILFGLTLAFQFYFEGLCHPRNLALAAGALILALTILVPTVGKLPLSVQRTLSFLPLPIDQVVRADAQFSSDWRIRVWQEVLPIVPKYLLLGRGYGFQPDDIDFSGMFGGDISLVVSSGDYHSGPLSVIVPFGIWGVIGFLWFLAASAKYLYHNHRHGPPGLNSINTLLLAFFLAQIVQFFLIYGMLPVTLPILVGVVALGVSLNGPPVAEASKTALEQEVLDLDPDLAANEIS